uniref:sulfotransferase family cytosolic 1B member 1-like isoform X1 n=1 Tax=Ciona intestinalis TaxID=7719 RepID=UPI0002B8D3AB|nr:sulfotransferase family cytosolic 1B member 1-like isoform X1 [Ciona intestinalis]|eukprot:XP_026693530.1 sulfotransferase family cytosolic 1B member 1-like isoform X1 [Ciona intestinalis]
METPKVERNPKIVYVTTKTGEKYAMPSHASQQCYDDAVGFPFDQDDVIIASYPKSGTTWTLNIVRLICGMEIKPGSIIESEFPFLESSTRKRLDEHKSTHKPAFYHTHIPCDHFELNEKTKYIWVLRNPKDVCVSFYHHTKLFSNLYEYDHGTFDHYFKLFASGKTDYDSYFGHVKKWSEHANDKNVLLLLYEDMKVDTRSAIKQIANFLGKTYAARVSNPVTMETIFEKCSFREMSQTMDQFSTVIKDGKCPVIRRGVVGDWRSLMTREQAEIIDRMTTEHGLQHYWKNYEDIV